MHASGIITFSNKAHGVHALQRMKSLNLDILLVPSESSSPLQEVSNNADFGYRSDTWQLTVSLSK